MAIKFQDKKLIVEEVNTIARSALSVTVADYRGVDVTGMTKLRVKARESNVLVRIIRNTLGKKAIENTQFEVLGESLVGPSILAFSLDDPGASARLFRDFAKEYEIFSIKAAVVDGELYSADKIDAIANLPTKDEAISLLMSVIQAPVGKLARTFNEFPAQAVRVLAAVGEKKKAA